MDQEVINKEIAENIRDEEEGLILPGFRFHPTDEELVGFYLRRKVENKKIKNIDQLIKQIDIYKHDPWDLPKVSTVGEKEWYFFCMRGRKYKNSVRPNRVTRSGFWKATGIDKPVYSTTTSNKSQNNTVTSIQEYCIIGLKKCLVYYCGSAGKGTKTDWMMHEFRLPPTWKTSTNANQLLPNTHEAEVWTLCRIFKRTSNYKRPYTQEVMINKQVSLSYGDSSSKACSLESENSTDDQMAGTSFQQEQNNQMVGTQNPSFWNTNNSEEEEDEYLFSDGKWDDLKSIVDLATDPSILYR